jgi:hypothetical protein
MNRPGRYIAITITLICSAASGCTSIHATYAPDGRRGYSVDCGGFLSSWSSCLVKAGRACGNRGYDTIGGNEGDRNLLVACKASTVSTVAPNTEH